MTNYSRSVLKSNGLRHSKNPPVRFSFSLKIVPANIAKKLPPQRCFKPLFIPVFNFSYKWPTFAFTGESGYTLGSAQRIAHSGLHAETGGVSDGGGITTLGAFRTFTNIPGPGIRTASFAAFGAWSGALPKNTESLRNSDALMRVAVPQASRPRWAALSLPVIVHRRALGVCHRCDKGQRTLLAGLLSFCLRCRGFFFSYSGAVFEPLFASIHARNLSFRTTIRLPILGAGKRLLRASS